MKRIQGKKEKKNCWKEHYAHRQVKKLSFFLYKSGIISKQFSVSLVVPDSAALPETIAVNWKL